MAAFEGELTDGFYGAAVPGPHPGCLTSREESADPFITRSRHVRNFFTGPLSARDARERGRSPPSSCSRRFAARVERPWPPENRVTGRARPGTRTADRARETIAARWRVLHDEEPDLSGARVATLACVYLATFAALGAAAWYGGDYYALALVERPRHPLHWELKPGGSIGRLYGLGGATLMVAMLSYSLRRRLPPLRKAGALARWLDFHIWCGVTGPLLIVLHSALKVGGLIAISFWSMVAVALSGVVGRFLYAQIPRTAAGDELSLDEARRLAERMDAELAATAALPAGELARLGGAESGGAGLAALLLGPLRTRREIAAFRAVHRTLPPATLGRIARLARERAALGRRLGLWRRLHELFHYWHVFHKPFAILMYLFAAVHVGVAWATGYAFGSP